MENLEVIFVDFRKSQLDKLVFEEFKITAAQVHTSHFFDRTSGVDVAFHNINSIQELLSPNGTGNIFLHQLEMGYNINDVMVVFSFDEEYGDVVFNFQESELITGDDITIKSNAKKFVKFLAELKEKFRIPKIRIGFEPASDDDTCLVELNEGMIHLDSIAEKFLI